MTNPEVKNCLQLPRVPDVVRDAVQNGEIPVDIAAKFAGKTKPAPAETAPEIPLAVSTPI